MSRRLQQSGNPRALKLVAAGSWREAHQAIVRSRSEAGMIAQALKALPRLDRESMGRDQFPFNEIASSQSVQTVVERLVGQRDPANPWNGAHKALMATDRNGKGYAAFVDAFRDAAFMVGVDYALRSVNLPDWWTLYQRLDARTQVAIGAVVQHAAKGGAR